MWSFAIAGILVCWFLVIKSYIVFCLRLILILDTEEADLVVIGSGPGGYVAAIKAAQLGLKVHFLCCYFYADSQTQHVWMLVTV